VVTRSLKSVVMALAAAAIFLIAGVAIHARQGVVLGDLTRDPVITAGVPVYTGFLSQLGIFGWAAAATAAGLAAAVLRRRGDSREVAGFLGWFAFLSLLLAVDDVFMLHEAVLPWIGIPQIVVLAAYACLAVGLMLRYRMRILESEFSLLAVASVLFGVSVLLDVTHLPGIGFDTSVFIEDGCKFTGIVCWAAYFWRYSALQLLAGQGRGGQLSA
jgi:hypothetical protein